ncbi:O-antigen ligase family protein [Paenibacillus spiritus]|uniref:O-antigen ligase family protein n=1 Tax=Paenibacillus spiritus TaxID=2496557 RepID=A0A5J5G9P6_9BACL|nr:MULTISPECIES: O-antigen ligase family protein [Paenibacillus]KAA9004680.1 O-antigen ligase family protein [Paenibacillus spiritus]
MTNHWSSRFTLLPAAALVFLLSALFIGTTVIYQPIVAVGLVCFILLLAVSLTRPEWISYFALLTTSISINFLFPGSFFGIEILSLYKLAVLMLLVPCILVNGVRLRLSPPVWAMAAMLIITFGWSDWLPGMSSSLAVKAFIGLSLPFMFMLINWKKEVAEMHIRLICLLPAFSLAAGLLLQAAGLHPMTNVEFNGAVRLQGANIPPHLAMLAFLGVAIPFIELKRRPAQARFFYTVLAVNLFILFATGTRGPLLALSLLVLYYLFDIARQYLKGKNRYLLVLLGSFAVIAVAVYMQLDNLAKRSFERTTDTGIDLSGRAEAWAYFLKLASVSPWTGRGLGSVTIANDGTLYAGFVVPHNEYIRFYFDGGYIGGILLLLSMLTVFVLVYRVLPRGVRPYYVLFIAAFMIYSFSDNTLSTVQLIIPFCWYLNCLYRSAQPTDSPQKEVIR